MLRFVLVLTAAITLSACGFTPQGDAVRGAVKDYGAQAYDAGLENAEWFLCSAASIGSIRRKYGRDQSMADAYNRLCNARDVEIVRPATLPQ